MTKKTKLRKITTSLILVLLLIISGSGAVYSWILGDITPNVKGQFSIGSASGLVLSLGSTEGTIADLNSYYGLTSKDLQLSECSSVDGNTIYVRDYSQYFEDNSKNEIVVLKMATNLKSVNEQIVGDYFEESFTLRLTYSDENDFYIYFLDGFLDGSPYNTGFSKGADSNITTDGLKALRIALYVDGLKDGNGIYEEDYYNPILFNSTSKQPKYAIFCNDHESSPEAVKTLGSIKLPLSTQKTAYNICQKVGTTMYGTRQTPTLYRFSDYALSNGSENVSLFGAYLPTGLENKYLFKLNQSYASVNITMRIWLEGLSDYCTDGKIGAEDGVDLNLYFVAYHLNSAE